MIAGAIFLFTLASVIWQPRGLGIGWSASIGAALALAAGGVQPGDIPVVWDIIWNATATLIALIIISLLLDEAGFFEWTALHVARWGLADPAKFKGDEAGAHAAFAQTLAIIERRCQAFFALDPQALDAAQLRRAVSQTRTLQ